MNSGEQCRHGMSEEDECYRCDHKRSEHGDDGCQGIWNGQPCPCPEFDEGEHWKGFGE